MLWNLPCGGEGIASAEGEPGLGRSCRTGQTSRAWAGRPTGWELDMALPEMLRCSPVDVPASLASVEVATTTCNPALMMCLRALFPRTATYTAFSRVAFFLS